MRRLGAVLGVLAVTIGLLVIGTIGSDPHARPHTALASTTTSTTFADHYDEARHRGVLTVDDNATGAVGGHLIEPGATFFVDGAFQTTTALPVRATFPATTCSGPELSADGGAIAYESQPPVPLLANPARRTAPSLRWLDLRTGADTLIATDACAPAMAADGRLAYRTGEGTVVVGPASGPSVTWGATLGQIEPVAWAGTTLLVRTIEPSTQHESQVIALDGPTAARPLRRLDARPSYDESVVAVSPDGRLVALAGGDSALDGSGEQRAWIRIAPIAGGPDEADLVLPRPDGMEPVDGRWEAGEIVAHNRYNLAVSGNTHIADTIVVLRVRPGQITIEAKPTFSEEADYAGVQVDSPRRTQDGQITMWRWFDFFVDAERTYLACNLDQLNCWPADHTMDSAVRVERRSRP